MQAIKRYKLVRATAEEAILAETVVQNMALSNPSTSLDFEISGIAQEVGKCGSEEEVASLICTYFTAYFDGAFSADDFSVSSATIWDKYKELNTAKS